MILATLNQKGGCGKTTLAVNLAGLLKGTVALVDADPQGSATRWSGLRQGEPRFQVVPLDAGRGATHFKGGLDRLAADTVVIDTPPELQEASMLAALLADLVLIPVTPSPFDFWGAEQAVSLAREAREQRGGPLPLAVLVPYRLKAGTVLARQLTPTLARLGEPVGPAIHDRIALVEAALAGQTIREYEPGGVAHREFQELLIFTNNEIMKLGRR